MTRNEALEKLKDFCKNLTPEDPENSARYILEFVESELRMQQVQEGFYCCEECTPNAQDHIVGWD